MIEILVYQSFRSKRSFVKLMAFLPFQNSTENSEWTLKQLLRSLCEFLKLVNW